MNNVMGDVGEEATLVMLGYQSLNNFIKEGFGLTVCSHESGVLVEIFATLVKGRNVLCLMLGYPSPLRLSWSWVNV